MHTRRSIVRAGLGGTLLLSGCSEAPTGTTTPTDTGSASSTPKLPAPRSYLPEPNDEWTRDRIAPLEVAPLGGADGIRGYYTGPDGIQYEVIVFVSSRDYNYAPGTAESFACAGWQVAFTLDRVVAVAASTGTAQRTFTPEAPPTMDQTPAPERVDEVRTLLALSSRLTADEIQAIEVQCR